MNKNEEKVEAEFEPYRLSEETKKNIGKIVGMDIDEFSKMDDDEQQKYIEKKNGRPMGHDCRFRIDGIPVSGKRTIENVNAKFDKLIEERKLGK